MDVGSHEVVELPAAPRGVWGSIAVPPSKSLTQRALVAAALAGSGSRVLGPLDAEDPRLLWAALHGAGHELRWEGGEIVAAEREPVTGGALFMGNNGTGVRFLIAVLAATPGEWHVDGSPRLRARPVAPLVDALRRLGAEVVAGGRGGELPLVVRGRALEGGEVTLDASISSQFVSALLLLGARLPRGLLVRLPAPPPSRPYLDLTADVLAGFGARVEARDEGRSYRIAGGALRPASCAVEGDWSAAAFPLCAVAVAGGRVEVVGVHRGSRQGDGAVLGILGRAGCTVETTARGTALEGPATAPVKADLRDTPDLFPPLAAVVATRGGTLTGLAALRVKESDRLAVMVRHLKRLGFIVDAGEDWFSASAGASPQAEARPLDPAADHRIAMALAVVGSAVPGLRVADAGCVAKSWPTFWDDWARLDRPGA